MWPKSTPGIHHIGNHLFEPGQIICNKHVARPNSDNCFIITSPYYCGSKCRFYFHIQHLSGKWRKSLTNITELDYKNVTNYMHHHYPEYFI